MDRSLKGYSPWGHKELDTTERLHFHLSLSCIGEGNGNPLQCSCLENPRNGEPGGLPPMGSHRVRHDWSDLAAAVVPAEPLRQAEGCEDGQCGRSPAPIPTLAMTTPLVICFLIIRFLCVHLNRTLCPEKDWKVGPLCYLEYTSIWSAGKTLDGH